MRWLSPPESVPEFAGQRQVIEADIDQELEALADLLEDLLGDLGLLRGEARGEGAEPGVGLPDREVADLGDVEPVELYRQRLGAEALAVAGGAGDGGLVALDLLAHPGGVGLLPAPLEIGDHALEGLRRLVGAEPVVIGEGDLLLAGAVEDDVAHLLRQLPPRRCRSRTCSGGPAPRASAGNRATRSCPTARWRSRGATACRRGRRGRRRPSARRRGRRRPGRRRSGC